MCNIDITLLFGVVSLIKGVLRNKIVLFWSCAIIGRITPHNDFKVASSDAFLVVVILLLN